MKSGRTELFLTRLSSLRLVRLHVRNSRWGPQRIGLFAGAFSPIILNLSMIGSMMVGKWVLGAEGMELATSLGVGVVVGAFAIVLAVDSIEPPRLELELRPE